MKQLQDIWGYLIMTNLTLLNKLKERNHLISEKDLFNTVMQLPLANIRNLQNLNTILEDNLISKFTDARDLLLHIEENSRSLDCKSADIRKLKFKEEIEKFEEFKRSNQKILQKILETQGILGDKNNSECIGCGMIANASGRCGC